MLTPEAIEAAARALCGTPFPDTWEKLGTDIQALYRHEAEDALTAALPFIAAQAKAEALREAADAILRETPVARSWASAWLRARAATIESGA